MNILMIHPHDLFAKSEPWTIRIINIAKEFIKLNHKVKLCYFPLSFEEKNTKKIDSIEIFPLERTPSPLSFLRNIKKIVELSKWADVVHFQKCHHYASIPTVVAAYLMAKPLHYDWDDWEEKIWYESCGKSFHSRFIGISFKVLERWLPILADSISCSSNHLKNLAHKFGVKKEYIFDSPVGADLEQFKLGLDGSWVRERYNIKGHLVLYIGQLHGAQYVDLLLKAANIVLHKYSPVTFMIVGEGFLEKKLKKLAYQLGIEGKIIFTGAIRHQDIPYYIAASDICVAPFRYTQVTKCKSPLKIVEYLASGKPIVASNVGEVRKMVGGVGMLVKPGDHRVLAEAIIFLLENGEIRKELGKRARKRAEQKYNWSYTAKSILSAYEKILNNS
ncbi:MAG: glycosyltransferase family 4 protein [Candidatus Omnitrophica bacterium]|nr:glycosyltransferase family 4 protein [Candidatus Omnitrophota bacterium]